MFHVNNGIIDGQIVAYRIVQIEMSRIELSISRTHGILI